MAGIAHRLAVGSRPSSATRVRPSPTAPHSNPPGLPYNAGPSATWVAQSGKTIWDTWPGRHRPAVMRAVPHADTRVRYGALSAARSHIGGGLG